MSDIKEDMPKDATATIRELNDKLRKTLEGGRLLLTRGIIDRPDVWQIIARVATFTEFDSGNDPHHEHDFGAFEINGDTIFWKIDYYNETFNGGSENPADPKITRRVLTIMRAEEY